MALYKYRIIIIIIIIWSCIDYYTRLLFGHGFSTWPTKASAQPLLPRIANNN